MDLLVSIGESVAKGEKLRKLGAGALELRIAEAWQMMK